MFSQVVVLSSLVLGVFGSYSNPQCAKGQYQPQQNIQFVQGCSTAYCNDQNVHVQTAQCGGPNCFMPTGYATPMENNAYMWTSTDNSTGALPPQNAYQPQQQTCGQRPTCNRQQAAYSAYSAYGAQGASYGGMSAPGQQQNAGYGYYYA